MKSAHRSTGNPFQFHLLWTVVASMAGVVFAGEPPADGPYGIPKRIPWTTSRIVGSLEPPAPYRTERVFANLTFTNPVVMTRAPGSERMFVVELEGKIYSFPNDGNVENADLFFDMKASIAGFRQVYGMAFHPDFARNRYVYLCYVVAAGLPDGTRVSRFTVSETEPPRIDPASEHVVIAWLSGGHNGGCLQFGTEGYLYVSAGDGAEAFPPDSLHAGQDVGSLPATVMRIDVDHEENGRPYAIPKDNPFVRLEGARGEVWAYGFRNPWKMSFDEETGDLWLGDVGWELWEMIYHVQRGGNYGWSLVEGPQPVHRERTRGPTPILPPAAVHSHTEARSITGGRVYRGTRLKQLVGAYIYGDHVTGRIWALRHDISGAQELVDSTLQIICFGADHDGELYVVDYLGTIHRLVENTASSANRRFPTRLSETGLFDSLQDHRLAPGVIPYSINAEPWADGTVASRFIALPGDSRLDVYDQDNLWIGEVKGQWKFPSNAVLGKTVSVQTVAGDPTTLRRIETQILHRDGDTWRAYAYVWNDAQRDAVLAGANGTERTIPITDSAAPQGKRQLAWRVAARTECILCHTTRAGSIHGFKLAQLNKSHDYARIVADQLSTLDHIGLFARPLRRDVPKMVSPYDESQDLNKRARAYLQVNCAHCHRRGGGGTAAIDVRYELPLESTNLLSGRPAQGTFAIHDARVVAPGDPFRSVLFYRMAKLGRGRMPYFGSNLVDQAGLRLMYDWLQKGIPGAGEQPAAESAALRHDESQAVRDLRDAAPEQVGGLVDRALSSTIGALMLLRRIDTGQYTSARRDEIVARAAAHSDVQVRDLFERFVPQQQRSLRLGSVVDPERILALAGDVSRGRSLFFDNATVQCKTCHRIGSQGGEVGPELNEIGKKYMPAQLLESLLQPSKTVDPKYTAYVAETAKGRVYVGLIVRRSDEEVVLRTAQAQEVRIPAAEIDRLLPQRTSLMPELLLRDMTAQEVADLLALFASLKGGDAADE